MVVVASTAAEFVNSWMVSHAVDLAYSSGYGVLAPWSTLWPTFVASAATAWLWVEAVAALATNGTPRIAVLHMAVEERSVADVASFGIGLNIEDSETPAADTTVYTKCFVAEKLLS